MTSHDLTSSDYATWKASLGKTRVNFSKWEEEEIKQKAHQAIEHDDLPVLGAALDWLDLTEATALATSSATVGRTMCLNLLIDRLFPDMRRRPVQAVQLISLAAAGDHVETVKHFLPLYNPNTSQFSSIFLSSIRNRSLNVINLLMDVAPSHVVATGLVDAISKGHQDLVGLFLPKVPPQDWVDVALMALASGSEQETQDRVDDFLMALPSANYEQTTRVIFHKTQANLPKARARASQQNMLKELGLEPERPAIASARRF